MSFITLKCYAVANLVKQFDEQKNVNIKLHKKSFFAHLETLMFFFYPDNELNINEKRSILFDNEYLRGNFQSKKLCYPSKD